MKNLNSWFKTLLFITLALITIFNVSSQSVPVLSLKQDLPEKILLSKITINDKLFIVGDKFYGFTQPYDVQFAIKRSVYEYDMINDTWTKKAEMPVRKNGFSSACVNGKIYTIGGMISSGKTNSVEMYDPETDQWSTKASMESSRNCAGCIALEDKIYVFGGSQPEGKPSVEVYDTKHDKWTSLSDMPTVKSEWTTVVESGGIIYVIGGYSGIFEAYDTTSNTWSQKENSVIPDGPINAASLNGHIYLFSFDSGKDKLTAEYDPETNIWTRKKDMPTVRGDCNLSIIDDEIYLIAGSTGPGGDILKSIEKYNPETDVWTLVANLSRPKLYTAVASTNNKFYVVGGYNETGTVDTKVELFELPSISKTRENNVHGLSILNYFPNPVEISTQFTFSTEGHSFVQLKIFNSQGQLMEMVLNEQVSPGFHSVNWTPLKVSKGVYYYVFTLDNTNETGKIIYR